MPLVSNERDLASVRRPGDRMVVGRRAAKIGLPAPVAIHDDIRTTLANAIRVPRETTPVPGRDEKVTEATSIRSS